MRHAMRLTKAMVPRSVCQPQDFHFFKLRDSISLRDVLQSTRDAEKIVNCAGISQAPDPPVCLQMIYHIHITCFSIGRLANGDV